MKNKIMRFTARVFLAGMVLLCFVIFGTDKNVPQDEPGRLAKYDKLRLASCKLDEMWYKVAVNKALLNGTYTQKGFHQTTAKWKKEEINKTSVIYNTLAEEYNKQVHESGLSDIKKLPKGAVIPLRKKFEKI